MEERIKKPDPFHYMMLSRLKQDCEYFLGAGCGHEKHLWALNVSEHISEMKMLWNRVNDKPEWLSIQDIESYEKKMITFSISNKK